MTEQKELRIGITEITEITEIKRKNLTSFGFQLSLLLLSRSKAKLHVNSPVFKPSSLSAGSVKADAINAPEFVPKSSQGTYWMQVASDLKFYILSHSHPLPRRCQRTSRICLFRTQTVVCRAQTAVWNLQ